MSYSIIDVMEYVKMEDVKFIRLAFCDLHGNLKNMSIMPNELSRAFSEGIAFDGSAIKGFENVAHSDLLLVPDPATLTVLPWRPSQGKVIRFFCEIRYSDGKVYENDSRNVLKNAVEYAKNQGITFNFSAEYEFYLFKTDENGEKTDIPYDNAGYMDVAPQDKGENIRREVCLTLEEMGIIPECSHHEEGPGQNEIDIKYSDALSSADHSVMFKNVVSTVAARNGLWASFDPKPIDGKSGNGMHINVSAKKNGVDIMDNVIAGILAYVKDITLFLNPSKKSYERLGFFKAPKYLSWSTENRSQLIRVPASSNGETKRVELRSPDPLANPYLAFALLIYAVCEAEKNQLTLPKQCDDNLFDAKEEIIKNLDRLPDSFDEAREIALKSEFVNKFLPAKLVALIKKA